MASTRLTQNHRSLLYALVTQIVDCPDLIKAEQRAYDRAMPHARKIVEARFPAADMKVLTRYDLSELDECIRVQHGDGSVQQFTFRTTDAPHVASRGNCRNRIFLSNSPQQAAIEAWVDAAKVLETETAKKRTEYQNFIESAATFEQVMDVWPEAMQLSNRIKINLPANVSPEMVARIKADSEARMKRMKKAA